MVMFIGSRRALLDVGQSNGLMAWDGSDLLADTKLLGPDGQALTFTPGMAKVAGQTFAAAPLVQGDIDGTSGDTLTFPRGDQIAGNW